MVKIYADNSGKETPFEKLSPKDQQAVALLMQKVDASTDEYTVPTWAELEIAQGEIIAASSGGANDKVLLFPSTGDEVWDMEIVQRNGIEAPQFSRAESWLRCEYNDGLMIFRDREAGIKPPPGDTRHLELGVDY